MFRQRRERFLEQIRPGVAILPSSPVPLRSNDVDHEYHQDPDLYYLTGYEEPDSVAVFAPGRTEGEFLLFVRPRNRQEEIWSGRRAGTEGAVSTFGAAESFPVSELSAKLADLLMGAPRVFYRVGARPDMDRLVIAALDDVRRRGRKGGMPPADIVDPGRLLHESRLIKSDEEVALLRKA